MATSQEKGVGGSHTQVKRWHGRRLIAENRCAPFFRFIGALGGVRGLRPSPTMDRPPSRASKDNSHTGSPQCAQSGFSLAGAPTPTNFR
jgi:hypothetical protein